MRFMKHYLEMKKRRKILFGGSDLHRDLNNACPYAHHLFIAIRNGNRLLPHLDDRALPYLNGCAQPEMFHHNDLWRRWLLISSGFVTQSRQLSQEIKNDDPKRAEQKHSNSYSTAFDDYDYATTMTLNSLIDEQWVREAISYGLMSARDGVYVPDYSEWFEEAIERDCRFLNGLSIEQTSQLSISSVPLWHEPNEMHLEWEDIRARYLSEGGEVIRAQFWINWYDSLMMGEAINWKLMHYIAITRYIDWTQPLDPLMAKLDGFVRSRGAQ